MSLNLIEALLLIALDDDNGRFVTETGKLRYGISGAILMELALEGKVEIQGDKLTLTSSAPSQSPVINEILDLLKITSKHGEIKYWVNKVGSKSEEVQTEVLNMLCEKKILRKEKDKFLWFISYDIYPTENMSPENEVREQIKAVVLENQTPSPKDLMLLNLIKTCELIREVFPGKIEHLRAINRIKELNKPESIEKIMDERVRNLMEAVNSSMESVFASADM